MFGKDQVTQDLEKVCQAAGRSGRFFGIISRVEKVDGKDKLFCTTFAKNFPLGDMGKVNEELKKKTVEEIMKPSGKTHL